RKNGERGGEGARRQGRQRPGDSAPRGRAPSHVHDVPRSGAMMPRCDTPIPDGTLLDYWARDLTDGDRADRVEEHLFGCADCSARLHRLAALRTGLVELVHQGRVSGIVSRALVNRMQRDGIHVRMYSLVPGETV